jgi:hypothetical protein
MSPLERDDAAGANIRLVSPVGPAALVRLCIICRRVPISSQGVTWPTLMKSGCLNSYSQQRPIMHYFSAFLPYYGPYFRSSRAFQGPVPYEIPFNPHSSRIDPPTATLRTDRNTVAAREIRYFLRDVLFIVILSTFWGPQNLNTLRD